MTVQGVSFLIFHNFEYGLVLVTCDDADNLQSSMVLRESVFCTDSPHGYLPLKHGNFWTLIKQLREASGSATLGHYNARTCILL
jgi:hypothetical protein